jgi:flavin reductase (DIM6/NTAB) family NADH-FMN oxidoreductase RutF
MPSSLEAFWSVLNLLPRGRLLMTGEFEQARAGAMVEWVTACSLTPACVCVALPKGLRLSPIVRDSRAFGLCLLDDQAKLLMKMFGAHEGDPPMGAPMGRVESDPFDAIEVTTLVSRSPIVAKCVAALDCEVIRHLDFEGDHELFVGRVVACRGRGE